MGPIDGHNLDELTEALMVAKMMQRPCLVHIYTKKGKGYAPAEDNSGEYHGLPPKKTMITIAKVSALQTLSEKLCSHLPIKTTAYMPLQPL